MTKDSYNRKKSYSNLADKIIELDPLAESLNKIGIKGGAAKSILSKNFKKSAKQAYKENKKFKVKNTLISKAGQKDLRQQSFANKLLDKVMPKINKEISKGGKNINKAKDYANIVKGVRAAKDKILSKYTKKN